MYLLAAILSAFYLISYYLRRTVMCNKLTFSACLILVLGLIAGSTDAQPLNQDPGPDGIVSVEAEHYDRKTTGQSGSEYVESGPTGGFTGVLGMIVEDGTEGTNNENYAAESPGLEFDVNFVKTGTHYVWILAWGPNGSGDSCHAGLDGEEIDTCDRMSGWNGEYDWSGSNMDTSQTFFEVDSVGVHTLNVWMREDGLLIDKIVLTTNPDFSLSGTEPGPPESSRGARVVAYSPTPGDGDDDIPRDVVLSWQAGGFAASHDVYFGTVFDDVNDADRNDPRGVLESRGQVATTYTLPERLDFFTTYYWRVDEVNAPPSTTVHKGTTWSFRTEPFSYQLQNITATASSSAPDKGPENVVNGSGLDENGLHGNVGEGTMWLSDMAGPQPAWIQFEFDTIHKLVEMQVWNSNESLEQAIGLGFKDVTIEYSTDGVNFTTLGTTHEFAQAPGSDGYASNTTIDMEGIAAKYVKLTANSNWKGLLPQFGLSEVQFFFLPVQARQPSPDMGATDVALDLDLSWRPGREAATHDVYFSDDYLAVRDGTASMTTVDQAIHGPLSLDLGKTYFWRVDEVNDVETPALWEGPIWEFTTIGSLVVDDFEGYTDNDAENEAIWQHWIDGFGVPANGSQVGNLLPPYAEQTIVHGGSQSMPLTYKNTGGVMNSEATLTLSEQKNWTIRGIGELSLWFRGYPASAGGFTESPAGTFTVTAEGADIWNQADEFHYVYKQLNGVGAVIARVDSVELTDVWAKAGVMIRETLDPGSKFAAVYITPTNDDGTPTQGCRFQARTDTDGSASSDTSVATDEQKAITAPYWVKVERDVAGSFRGSYSSDGNTWIPMVWRPAVTMDSDVYIGLALTSHNAGVQGTAVFSGIQTEGDVTGQWQSQDIGILSNSAESLYVEIANADGTAGVVLNDDPAATQIDTWTQWRIDLRQLADQGVNLADVDSISIGIGDKSNPQPGGTGIMYFDDIELVPPRAPLAEAWIEAEAADIIGASWKTYDDPAASGGKGIGSDDGDGNDNDFAPGDEWIATYSFNVPAGDYKILLRGQEAGADSFWVRIPEAIRQSHEDPDQPETGWVRFNGMDAPDGWAWDEVHSDDHDDAVVTWMLPGGDHTLEIGKREDGVLLDAILITNNLGQSQEDLPDQL
jgi:hypothetical protein